jgi:hypothetical protein
MKDHDLSIPKKGAVSVPNAEVQSRPAPGWSMATRDHDVIRGWAARHHAEPATGEATSSGPATINVNDGGVGIRFNFPGFGRFRPISWTEWLEHFDRNRLTFVYQQEVADRAYALWQSRGGDHGHDRQDWFDAEEQLRQISDGTSGRYWFVQHGADTEE